MNMNKVLSGFFFILAMTLNFGFFYGTPEVLAEHSKYELFAAIVVNLIATIFKFGDKTQVGSVLLATSLVADTPHNQPKGSLQFFWKRLLSLGSGA